VEQERETEVQALGSRWRIPGISGPYRWLGEAAETEPRFGQALSSLELERGETPLGRRPYYRPTRRITSRSTEGGVGGGKEHCRRVRSSPHARGLGSVWLRCPLAAARKIIMEGGRPKVGWASEKDLPLLARCIHCYRSLKTGHVRRDCKSEIDRSDRCYRCGGQGHRSRDCVARASRYTICEDAGLPAAHRMGSQACNPPTAARRRRGTQPEETGIRSRTREGSVGRAVPGPDAPRGARDLENSVAVFWTGNEGRPPAP
jgi:hypothetical protein